MNGEANMQSVVSAENLSKVFHDFWRRPKKRAVDGVSFSIRKGEVFGLLGPNGSGKSTTIKMLLGLLRPTSGTVAIMGGEPSSPAVRARIGYLPEVSSFHKYLTPRETLNYYGGLFGLSTAERRKRSAELLERLGIADAADRPVGEFSKGMARRAGLAQALINDPELLVLDEPTSGLDPIGRHAVKELVKSLAAEGKTVLLSSHLLAEVEDVCNRVAILCDGKIRASGELSNILEKRGQIRLTMSGVDETLAEKLKRDVEAQGGSAFIDRPAMSLEKYFLETVEGEVDDKEAAAGEGSK